VCVCVRNGWNNGNGEERGKRSEGNPEVPDRLDTLAHTQTHTMQKSREERGQGIVQFLFSSIGSRLTTREQEGGGEKLSFYFRKNPK